MNAILESIDELSALPDLSSSYEITPEQIEAFRRDGHVLLRGVCSTDEIAAYRTVIRNATARLNKEIRKLEERDTYGKAFLQTLNLRLHDAGVRQFALARRFGKIAADLMDVSGTRIFHEQSLFKEPGGGKTPWHQDQYYWPLSEMTTLGMWMPLVDVSSDMGCMKFASGSHHHGFLGQHAISDGSEATYERYIAENELPVVSNPMKAGDATFHYGWTLHGAGANVSQTMREAMIVTMFADGMRVAEPQNKSQENDRVVYLGGRAPGELADSTLNTLLYSSWKDAAR
jgi:ectoine hydroxylase-related dioxygenase (phytanoyl-CoA dioxygenase family)